MVMKMLAPLAAAVLLGAPVPAGATTVRLGSVADFSPYNYLDDDGELQGFEAELADILCARAGLTCEWALAPWDDMLTSLLEYDFDVIMTAMQITPARELYIDFSDEYFPADPSAFIARFGGAYPSDISVVGAQTATLQAEYVNDNGWSLSPFTTPEDGLQALVNMEIAAFVGDQAYLQEIVDANPGQFQLVATGVVIGGGIGLGVRQSNPTLLGQLNDAIASVKADGTLDALIGEWFNGRDPNYRGGY
ncbi:MAG: transporter substrate-binding domain-containing protein [Rhodobacteraceae bacterium]|nr:transporter substrate-binding domain-containing protein [Paracoccaceae bacterium]